MNQVCDDDPIFLRRALKYRANNVKINIIPRNNIPTNLMQFFSVLKQR